MLPLADGTDQALVLAAAECVARGELVGLLVGFAVPLGPPTLRAESSPSILFEPEADRPLLGRLTLGAALSPSSHKDPSSGQPSAPAALFWGGRVPGPVDESVREFSRESQ